MPSGPFIVFVDVSLPKWVCPGRLLRIHRVIPEDIECESGYPVQQQGVAIEFQSRLLAPRSVEEVCMKAVVVDQSNPTKFIFCSHLAVSVALGYCLKGFKAGLEMEASAEALEGSFATKSMPGS